MPIKERTLLVRGKPVTVREITGIVAVRGGTGSAAADQQLTDIVPGPELAAFTRAGWSFVPTAVGTNDSSKVYLKSGGRLAIGTDRLTVQVKSPQADEPQQVFQKYGVNVVRPLKFAPGLYEVTMTPTGGRDALDVAGELVESGEVVFAEPEMIEMLSHR